MRQFILAIVVAIIAAVSLTGCTGQRSAADQSMTAAVKSPASSTAGQGVEDPRG